MKLKMLLYFLLGNFILSSASAYEVSTTVQKKNILLEEFTGMSCGYCPQGHAIANSILVSQPASTYVIAIHAGSFAGGTPDFRTDVGTEINNTIGAETAGIGYPSGTVNRHIFRGNNIVSSRDTWTKDAKLINEETAPVNLWMRSEFDGSNRLLTVKVEGYYVSDVNTVSNFLNVAIVQNNVKGPQTGGLVGSDYIHMHMLRDYVTPLWGDVIEAPKAGEYFSREYTYTLPADINNVELKAEDIELIAFVCEDKCEVLNVTGGKPSYVNYEKPLSATLLPPDHTIDTNYGYRFFEAKLKNNSSETITSATFDVTINGNTQRVDWEGTLHAFETLPIRIYVDTYVVDKSNKYEISLVEANNKELEPSIIKGSFAAPVVSTPDLTFEFQTDLYGDENQILIKDEFGNVVKEYGPYEKDKKAIYKEDFTLEKDKVYCVDITDAWGDGIQSPYGTRGYFKLNNKGGSMIAQQYEISLYGYRSFFKTSSASGIENLRENNTYFFTESGKTKICFTANISGAASISLYTISGELIFSNVFPVEANDTYTEDICPYSLNKGFYLVKLSQGDKHETLKVAVQ